MAIETKVVFVPRERDAAVRAEEAEYRDARSNGSGNSTRARASVPPQKKV